MLSAGGLPVWEDGGGTFLKTKHPPVMDSHAGGGARTGCGRQSGNLSAGGSGVCAETGQGRPQAPEDSGCRGHGPGVGWGEGKGPSLNVAAAAGSSSSVHMCAYVRAHMHTRARARACGPIRAQVRNCPRSCSPRSKGPGWPSLWHL